MVRQARYPLEALLRLRRELCRQQELALAEATRALELGEERLLRAQEQLDGKRVELDEARGQIASLAPRSAARVHQQTRFVDRLVSETEQLAGAVRQAEAEIEQRRRAREGARQALADAQAELELVERNHEAWTEARRQQELARAEQELEDLVAARHGTR
jgi:DNA repair exonuclease SbcCD ATPase subunit